MALVSRSPVRITAAPSTAPHDAMVASLQAHIDELVQKNRTCEHSIKRLQQALADEKERGVNVVNRIKAASQQEREEWKEGCDSLLASHRIVHLRTRIELDKERINVLKERDESRKERISSLHRDFKLTLFQAKETDLEAKIAELEDALEEVAEQNEQDATAYVAQQEEAIASLNTDLSKADLLRKEVMSKLRTKETEVAKLQAELINLREEIVTLKTSGSASTTKLERAILQLDGAKTDVAELQTANGELKRTNQDLKRQLDQWQNLETKGGAEMEEMRKRRIELEVHVKELQGRVKELEKLEKDSAKSLEKEQKKVEKLRKEIERMTEVTVEAQDLATKSQAEAADSEDKLRKAHKLIERLEISNQNISNKGKKPAHEAELAVSDVEPDLPPGSEREVEIAITPVAKPRARSRITQQKQKTLDDHESTGESDEEATKPGAGKRGGVARFEQNESDSEQDQSELPQRKSGAKGKPKAAIAPGVVQIAEAKHKGKGKGKALVNADEDAPRTTSRARQKAKETSDDYVSSSTALRPSSQNARRKPSSSQARKNGESEHEDEADIPQQPKKKKRLFPPSQPLTFAWDALPQGDGGLGIPTELSPVKETDAVPSRSVFGRVGSALGWK